MRRVLVEHARAHNAEKRGGKLQKIYLDETKELARRRDPDLVELDEVLQSFASTYPRESEVVELKFFGGLKSRRDRGRAACFYQNSISRLDIREALALQ